MFRFEPVDFSAAAPVTRPVPREVTQWTVIAFRVTSTVQDAKQIIPRSWPLDSTRVITLLVLRMRAMMEPIRVRRATSRSLPLDGPCSIKAVDINGRIKRLVSQMDKKMSYRSRVTDAGGSRPILHSPLGPISDTR